MLVDLSDKYFNLYQNYLESYIVQAKQHAKSLTSSIFDNPEFTAEESSSTLKKLQLLDTEISKLQLHLLSQDNYIHRFGYGLYSLDSSHFEWILRGKNQDKHLYWVTNNYLGKDTALSYLYGRSLRHKGTATTIAELERYLAFIPNLEQGAISSFTNLEQGAISSFTKYRTSWAECTNIVLINEKSKDLIEWEIIFLDEWDEMNRQQWDEWKHNFSSFTPHHFKTMV